MSLDDHEVIDNFGSAPEHASASFRHVRQGALDACWDYQALRVMAPAAVRPSSLHFSFDYGPVSVFVMDVRSERRHVDGRLQVYSDGQHEALRRFLRERSAQPVIALVTGVPIVDVPDWLNGPLSRLDRGRTDLSDRWSTPAARACRKRLLGLLFQHQCANPAQRLVLVAGDIHTGSAFELHWEGTPHRMLQLNASALSNLRTTPLQWLLQKTPGWNRRIHVGSPCPALRVALVPGTNPGDQNPYGDLNLGILQICRAGRDTSLRLRIMTHDSACAAGFRAVFTSPEF
jgi:hypothetical protein